jgi:hypothetical protein
MTGSSDTHAFVWTAATGMVDIGGGTTSLALGVNDAGQVVGQGDGPSGCCFAFSWTATGGMTSIASGVAYAISNAGQVVGEVGGPPGVPVVWSAPRGDVTIDFGPAQGIWAFKSLAVWQLIHSFSPESAVSPSLSGGSAMVTGDLDGNGLDDLVVDFGATYDVWVWTNHATWTPLKGLSPTRMVTGDLDGNGRDEVILDFPGYGLWCWTNNTSWSQLHSSSVPQLATGQLDGTGGEELIVNFSGLGLWIYQSGRLDPVTCERSDEDRRRRPRRQWTG